MNEMIKELMPYLEKLADKLDSSARVLWQMQLAQSKVIAWSYGIRYGLWVIGFIIYLIACFLSIKIDKKHESNGEFSCGVIIGGGAFGVVLYVFWLPALNDLLTAMFNPDLWALQEIIKMVK